MVKVLSNEHEKDIEGSDHIVHLANHHTVVGFAATRDIVGVEVQSTPAERTPFRALAWTFCASECSC